MYLPNFMKMMIYLFTEDNLNGPQYYIRSQNNIIVNQESYRLNYSEPSVRS